MEACRFTFKLLSVCVVIVIWTYFLETIWIEDILNENDKIHESSLSHITHARRMCAVQADTKHRNRSLFRINFNPVRRCVLKKHCVEIVL